MEAWPRAARQLCSPCGRPGEPRWRGQPRRKALGPAVRAQRLPLSVREQSTQSHRFTPRTSEEEKRTTPGSDTAAAMHTRAHTKTGVHLSEQSCHRGPTSFTPCLHSTWAWGPSTCTHSPVATRCSVSVCVSKWVSVSVYMEVCVCHCRAGVLLSSYAPCRPPQPWRPPPQTPARRGPAPFCRRPRPPGSALTSAVTSTANAHCCAGCPAATHLTSHQHHQASRQGSTRSVAGCIPAPQPSWGWGGDPSPS